MGEKSVWLNEGEGGFQGHLAEVRAIRTEHVEKDLVCRGYGHLLDADQFILGSFREHLVKQMETTNGDSVARLRTARRMRRHRHRRDTFDNSSIAKGGLECIKQHYIKAEGDWKN